MAHLHRFYYDSYTEEKCGGGGAEKVLAMLKGGSFGVVLMW